MHFKLTTFACLLFTCLFVPINGYKAYRARVGEVRHQLSIEEMIRNVPTPKHVCTASAIHPSWALTAGFCVLNMKINGTRKENFQVVAGKYNISNNDPPTQLRKIDSVYTPDEYPPPTERIARISLYDIGLIKLDRELKLNIWVQLIALPEENEDVGKKAHLSGWSLVRSRPAFDYGFPLEWLNVQTLSILSKSHCEDCVPGRHFALSLENGFPYDHVFCAGPSFTTYPVCIGDTGSGLIKKQLFGKNKIIGVLSYVVRLGVREEEGPSVYTRVSQFLRWISSVMSAH